MAVLDKATLKLKIDDYVIVNAEGAITEVMINELLNDIVDSYSDGGLMDADTLQGDTKAEVIAAAVATVLAGVTPAFDTLEKVEAELISIAAQFAALVIADIGGLQAALDLKLEAADLTAVIDNTRHVAGVFDASISQVLHTDSKITISWDAVQIQATYAVAGWLNTAGHAHKTNGSAFSDRVSSDLKTGDGTWFFPGTGAPAAAYDHDNFGSFTEGSVVKELYDTDFPSYILNVVTGDTADSGAFHLTIINPQ